MGVGNSSIRVDAYDKVCGKAKYTADMEPKNCLIAKLVRSTIANGIVKEVDTSEALKVDGVVKIFTCFDVPDIQFPTAGHPWSVEEAHKDICDRRLLTSRIHQYGDDVAVVVATDEVAASRAARLVKITYEEYEAVTDVDDVISKTASGEMKPLHDERPNNIVAHSTVKVGDCTYEDALKEDGLITIDKVYTTQTVQHCHIELVTSIAYMEGDRVTIISSTQIPHIVRRIVGQALDIDWGRVRVIKPYVGGGFGNKQDALYEPLNAYLTYMLGGRPVKLELTREEVLSNTRVRHAIKFDMHAALRPNGRLVARKYSVYSNQGAYASHGHSIAANSTTEIKWMYDQEKSLEAETYTVYSNIATGGAMRGYGIPQSAFAVEAMADDMAIKLGMDPFDFRMMNCIPDGYVDPGNGIPYISCGLKECMEKGAKLIGFKEKREKYKNQTGSKRRGIGMAIFVYKTGVYPISLETAACRMILNQDGSMMLAMGATEIGQGADTVFTQMASEAVGISENKVHIVSTQDTDTTPFDTGAYASRQTYVSGMALKKTAESFKKKILEYAEGKLKVPADKLDIKNDYIVDKDSGDEMISLEALATEAYYSLEKSVQIAAEETNHCKKNTISSGATFVEVEVDIPLGKVKILNFVQVHDSGILINPKLAEAQVHGGISMGIGFGLYEELLYNEKGRPLNNNLLDYKMPTALDMPDLKVDFVELEDPTGPFGNKALGEPPAIPPAPAIRNAVLNATGVAVDSLPLHPQKLVEEFVKAGLLKSYQ